MEATEPVKKAGELILERLDDDGYLREKLEDLASSTGGKISYEDLEAALPLVQQLEPLGVGVRDLKECLMIQLAAQEASGMDVSLERELIRSFSQDIQANRLPLIARKTNHTVEEIIAALTRLSHLNPPRAASSARSLPRTSPRT